MKDLISLRTRSRHPMTDTTLESLELSFVPPDITPDMYETEIDNPDWAEFLRDFVLLTIPNAKDTHDDECGCQQFVDYLDIPYLFVAFTVRMVFRCPESQHWNALPETAESRTLIRKMSEFRGRKICHELGLPVWSWTGLPFFYENIISKTVSPV